MKVKIKVEKEVEILNVKIDIEARYIGDNEDDDMPTDFPLLNAEKTAWVATVAIDTGAIFGWPKGDARKMHVKVCDAGVYTLFDNHAEQVAQRSGYVPHGVVPGSFGDYVELDIDENGIITNWPKHPDVSEFFRDDDE